MNLMFIAIAVIVVVGLIPILLRRRLINTYLRLLQKNDINGVEMLVASKLAKTILPQFNREYMLLNSYIRANDNNKAEAKVNKIISEVPMNDKQKATLASQIFYKYIENQDEKMTDKIVKMMSETKEYAIHRQMDMINDTLVKGGNKYLDELKTDVDDEEYRNVNKDISYQEFLLAVIYKNMNNSIQANKYKNMALRDSKGTSYESLIHSQLSYLNENV